MGPVKSEKRPVLNQKASPRVRFLMKNHEKAFSDIKNYYNDITLNNLALINTLKVRTALNSLITTAH